MVTYLQPDLIGLALSVEAVYELFGPADMQANRANLTTEAVAVVAGLRIRDAVRALWRRLPAPVRTTFTWLLRPTSVFGGLRALFKRLPKGLQARVYVLIEPTGLHHCLNYLAYYRWTHRPEHFAASIPSLSEEYWRADQERKRELSEQFVHIVEGIVLRNGVKKTTSFSRQTAILSRVLPRLKFDRDRITVLDVPSSIGMSSLATYDLLSGHWPIASYVLGDLCLEVVYDSDRDCVFDAGGDLLQVRGWSGFFSVHRPTFSSGPFQALSSLMLLPLHLRSWYSRRRYRFDSNRAGTPVVLLHPDAERRVREGVFQLRKTDIFSVIQGTYDLILSFNLLVTRYFSKEQIEMGKANLANALNEGGALVMGHDTSHQVFQKTRGEMVLVASEGEL